MKVEKVERSIVFQGQTLADTNPQAPIQDVVRGYATTCPELLNAELNNHRLKPEG